MSVDFLFDVFNECKNSNSIIWNNKVYDYKSLTNNIINWRKTIRRLFRRTYFFR